MAYDLRAHLKKQWDPVDEEEEIFQQIYEEQDHGRGIVRNYFNSNKDEQVLRRYLQEQQYSEDKIDIVLRRLVKWDIHMRFQTSFGPRDYAEAISSLNLQSSKMDIKRFNDRKDSRVDAQRPMSLTFRVGDKILKDRHFSAYGDLHEDADYWGRAGPNQQKMLDQPGVSELDHVGAFRIGSETYIAVEAGSIGSDHLLLWLLDRQRFAVVHNWDNVEPSLSTDWFLRTDLRVSFALLSGNPFSEEGAVLEDIQVTDFVCEVVGIHPEKGIHAAPIPDVLDLSDIPYIRWEGGEDDEEEDEEEDEGEDEEKVKAE